MNENECVNKKNDDQLCYLEEVNLDKPEPVMIDELDEIHLIIESDEENSEQDCLITSTQPST
jgi:hypothetical protein